MSYDSDRKKASDRLEAGWGKLKELSGRRDYKETLESEALF